MVNRSYSFRFDSTFALALGRRRGYGGFLKISFSLFKRIRDRDIVGQELEGY
jgi:hypothetical protein